MDEPPRMSSGVVFFAVRSERVEIIGVFHGGRDYAALLDAEDE